MPVLGGRHNGMFLLLPRPHLGAFGMESGGHGERGWKHGAAIPIFSRTPLVPVFGTTSLTGFLTWELKATEMIF